MKTLSIRSIRATVVAATLAVASFASMNAQGVGSSTNASIPFNFECNGQTYPAGAYTMRRKDSIVTVSGRINSGSTLMRPEVTAASPSSSKIVFHHVGSQYFLREIWSAGQTRHFVAAETKGERKARESRRQASVASAVSTVEVAVE